MDQDTNRIQKKKQFMRKVALHNRIILCAFLLILISFNIGGLISKDVEFSENENRNMAKAPAFSWSALMDGSYASGWDSYITDQFFARKKWIEIKLSIDKFFGKKEANGVYLGKDGYLMEIPAKPDDVWVEKNITALNAFADHYSDLNFYMSVIPNAAYILDNKIPNFTPVRDQSKDMEMLASALQDNVQFLDMTLVLDEHQEEDIYYRTDHHWTSLGAYYAFTAMAPELGIKNPVKEYDTYTVSDDFSGTMASKSGYYKGKDLVQIYVPKTDNEFIVTFPDSNKVTASLYDGSALETKDKYTVFLGGNHARVDISTTNDNHKRLLLLKDSYANCFVQFLTPYYEDIIMIDPRYYYDELPKLIEREKITDVLLLYNMNTYLQDKALADTLVLPEIEELASESTSEPNNESTSESTNESASE